MISCDQRWCSHPISVPLVLFVLLLDYQERKAQLEQLQQELMSYEEGLEEQLMSYVKELTVWYTKVYKLAVHVLYSYLSFVCMITTKSAAQPLSDYARKHLCCYAHMGRAASCSVKHHHNASLTGDSHASTTTGQLQ